MSGVIYLAHIMLIRIDITFGPMDGNHSSLSGPPPPPFLDDDHSDSESLGGSGSEFSFESIGSDLSGVVLQGNGDRDSDDNDDNDGSDEGAGTSPANSPLVPPSTSSDSDIEILFRPIPLGATFFGARNRH